MKKSILIMLVALVLLGSISLIGCRGGTTPSGTELNWDDMPVYAAASQVKEANWALPPQSGDWAKMEWRYYKFDETYTSIAEVTMFYRNEMPKNGWQENVWIETQGTKWCLYDKDNGQDSAMIWIGSDEGHTVFALMKASD